MTTLDPTHHCAWRVEAERLRSQVQVCHDLLDQMQARLNKLEQMQARLDKFEQMQERIAYLERVLWGRNSEKMPTPSEELRQQRRGSGGSKASGNKARAAKALARKQLPEIEVVHEVGEDSGVCESCGQPANKRLGEGKVSFTYTYVPARFERHKHIRRTMACPCGSHIVTARGPAKVVDKGRYGPGFVAHVITSKCADSLPIYRLQKQCKRLGVPVARSTMTELFHRGAELLTPIHGRILDIIAKQPIVQADETTMPIQRKGGCKRGYVWTFLSGDMIGYRFSGSRSGETPRSVLGATSGVLVVDAYTGYNAVTTPEQRERAGCLAHVRRKYFDALGSAPKEARHGMDLILEVYRVEHEAAEAGKTRSAEHSRMRKSRSRAAMDALVQWCENEQGNHLPRGPLGKAIHYTLAQRKALRCFIDNVDIPVDNNASERALRVMALGRKNYLFVGHIQAGRNLAVLHTLVACCELHQVNPMAYLTDMLIRVQDTPSSRIDELLPWRWKPPDPVTA